jgi:hypothetical protein
MKRRVTSIILTLVMMLSLFPMNVLAASEGPALKMHVVNDEGEQVFDEWTQRVDDHWRVRFYLHDADGSTTPVDAEDVNAPAFVKLTDEDEDGWVDLWATDIGAGKFSYGQYTMPVSFFLPGLGLYKAKPFTMENLIFEPCIDDENNTFYIALSPNVVEDGTRMADINSEFGPDMEDVRNLLDVADITLSQDGTYATVTITDMTAEEHYHFEAKVTNINDDDDSFGNWGRSVWINNNMPNLFYCYLGKDNDQWFIEYERLNDTMWCVPGYSHSVAFFFGKRSEVEAGRVAPIPVAELTFPAYLKIEDLAEHVRPGANLPSHTLEVRVTRFAEKKESTDIIYEHDGTEYVVSAETHLPDVGFYSSTNASKATYIYDNNPFVFTEENRTVYLCVSDPGNMKLTSEWEWEDEDAEAQFTVTPSENEDGEEDGKYLAITLKKDKIVTNDRFHMEVKFQRRDNSEERWRTERYGSSLAAKNGQPTLMYRYLDWDNDRDTWYEDEERNLNTSLYFSCGDSSVVKFYYGTEEKKIPVDISELTFPAGVAKGFISEDVIRVEGIGFEKIGHITYNNGDVTASMKVESNRPEIGFYSSVVADENSFLNREVPVDQTVDTFYLVADSDRSAILDIEKVYKNYNENDDVTAFFAIDVGTDANGCDYAEITLKKGDDGKYLAPGGEYVILVERDWGTHYLDFKLLRNDLEQLATPTDLEWHIQYGWDWENAKLVSEDRMGSMAFKTNAPSQNRYELEVYSDADGYTSPVLFCGWQFGDMDHSDRFSVSDFIYADLPSGIYRFRVKAEGDGTKYRDSNWSDLSPKFKYTKPKARLIALDEETFAWERWDAMYHSTWTKSDEAGARYYEIRWSYMENGVRREHAGSFDIEAWDENPRLAAGLHDDFLSEIGNKDLYFRVRVIPADITQYRISAWSAYSEALVIQDITDFVNGKLDNLLNQQPSQPDDPQPELTVQQVQDALISDTADLRTAMAADLELSGGPSSGTLEKIVELEKTVSDNVDQKIEAKSSAPQPIKDIAAGVTMVGATLNLADKHSDDNDPTPTVTLELDEPKEGIVIPEQQHNAVQFSMKLNGAVDKNDQDQAGQLLIVPVVIDMPVPAGINPYFLVVLHKLWDGSIEQMRPYIYWNDADNRYHARFVVDSFSDFAFVEYFGFNIDVVNKTVGDAPFIVAATSAVEGSVVTYSSSDCDVAVVDSETGEVTIKGAGTVTITATASAYDIYSETSASYTLVITGKRPSGGTSGGSSGASVKPENPFGDVAQNAYYYDAVLWAVENGITSGTSEDTFSPNASCTRAQMVTFLWRAAGKPEPTTTLNPFVDVAPTAYYYKAVLWAMEQGITNGVNATTFGADMPCNRGQMATFLWRTAGKKAPSIQNTFADVKTGMYYSDAVLWAAENGITNGKTATAFGPDDICTRGQMVTFLYRHFAK